MTDAERLIVASATRHCMACVRAAKDTANAASMPDIASMLDTALAALADVEDELHNQLMRNGDG